MELVSTTTRRNDREGTFAVTFVLDGALGHRVVDEERTLRIVTPELERTLDRLGWDDYAETLAKIVPQPNDRVHVHFAYQRRG